MQLKSALENLTIYTILNSTAFPINSQIEKIWIPWFNKYFTEGSVLETFEEESHTKLEENLNVNNFKLVVSI